jgi:hypothetical protein
MFDMLSSKGSDNRFGVGYGNCEIDSSNPPIHPATAVVSELIIDPSIGK